jgi:hypothetical protein
MDPSTTTTPFDCPSMAEVLRRWQLPAPSHGTAGWRAPAPLIGMTMSVPEAAADALVFSDSRNPEGPRLSVVVAFMHGP